VYEMFRDLDQTISVLSYSRNYILITEINEDKEFSGSFSTGKYISVTLPLSVYKFFCFPLGREGDKEGERRRRELSDRRVKKEVKRR
jgi:hypothetical protein